MSNSQPIRVMLVDDHLMVRRGLATFLKVFDDLELVGEAESGETAVQLCAQLLPDVVLMDMMMPDMDGPTATRLIRQQHPRDSGRCPDELQRAGSCPECTGGWCDWLLT